MQIDTRKLKKLIIKAVPYVAFSYVGNLIGFAGVFVGQGREKGTNDLQAVAGKVPVKARQH